MRQLITIKSIEQKDTATGNTKIILKDDTHKYFFYKKKKDGSISKSYEQWKSLQDEKQVTAEVTSEEKTFKNDKGKDITYMENFIGYFVTEGNIDISTYTQAPKTPQNANSDLTEMNKRLDNASKAFVELDKKLTDRINALEMQIGVMQLEINELKKIDN